MRIGLLTSRSAKGIIEDVVRSSGIKADIVEVPVPVISFLSTRTIAKIISSRRELYDRLSRCDVILIPGRVRGDAGEIERVLGKPVYKGPRDIGYIPSAIKHLYDGGVLDRVRPAEEFLAGLDAGHGYEAAFTVNGLEIPLRGPPVHVVAEVHPDVGVDSVVDVVERYLRDGAKIILVGASHEMDPDSLSERIRIARDAGAGIVFSEAPSRTHARAVIDEGVDGLSVSPEVLAPILDLIDSGHAIIIGDRDLGRIRAGLELLDEVGVSRVIIDPVLGLPLLDLSKSIARYIEARGISKPLLFTAANVTEEIEADTHGVHAVLASIAVEVGASLYLVVEETYKSIHGVAEATEALRISSLAWEKRSTPRGLYSRLYVVKQPTPPAGVQRLPGAERVGYIEPRMDRNGFIEVYVDHGRGVIGAIYRRLPDMSVEAAVEGVHPNSVARALIRRIGLDPEHAAYLGIELEKAYIALRLGLSYTQDEDVVSPVWEKVYRVEGDGKQSC